MSRPRKPRHNRLIRSFMDEMIRSGHTFTSLSKVVGLTDETMSNWGRRGQPRLDTLDRAVAGIGCRLVIRRKGG